jgi:hypothetical protein
MATSGLTDPQRERLAVLADILMPGSGALPSPSEAGTHQQGIDRVLAVRPDLALVIRSAADVTGDAAAQLAVLRAADPAAFELLSMALAGAYVTVPRVRRTLGYPGVAPRPAPAAPDEAEYYLDDDLLEPVTKRGPIYRPTPAAAP